MSTVRSPFTTTPPVEDGLLPSAEWSGAGTMTIPEGVLMVKNDLNNLYVALDLQGDTGNDPGTNDYFWFIVDVDNNGVINPNRDKLFSPWPGNPNRLGMWLMAGPDETWPAPNTQVIPSQVRIGFGPSLNFATSHRRWEIRFALSDLGVSIVAGGPSPVVRFGLRVASSTPAFIQETPTNPLGDFSNFHQIILSTAPVVSPPGGTTGVVIGAVGLIGTGSIGADGYSTITLPYYVQPDEAAFSGTLNLIGNVTTLTGLWGAGARKYRVRHRFGNTVAAVNAAAFSNIRQSWANFREVGSTDVWESFGPDGSDMYPLVDPGLAYTIQNLLFQWSTGGEPDGLHQFAIDFFNAGGSPVASTPQTVTLKLDNQPPTVQLIQILHGGSPVSACAIETMSSPTDGVQLVYEAFDPEGDLYIYTLTALYGHGLSSTIFSDGYAAHRNPAHNWQGVSSDTKPAPGVWVPPFTCAYMFQIGATPRTTNGYIFPISTVYDFQTVTLIKPGILLKARALTGAPFAAALGFKAPEHLAKAGPAAAAVKLSPVHVKPTKK